MARKAAKAATIVVRREEIVQGGHHGGAWKVAYADFVTAMMAFFLLMWLINATTEKQRRGIADYFSPQNAMGETASGSGKPFGGTTPFSEGSLVSDRGAAEIIPGINQPLARANYTNTSQQAAPRMTEHGGAGEQPTYAPGTGTSGMAAAGGAAGVGAAPAKAAPAHGAVAPRSVPPAVAPAAPPPAAPPPAEEAARFAEAARAMRAAVLRDKALAGLADQLKIDETPAGLRIQIVDQDKQPMFASGSAALDPRAAALLLKIAPILNGLSEGIAITGHTDAAPYRGTGKTNWELSSERAEATLRLLMGAGLAEARVRRVSGVAASQPLLPKNPMAAVNRRITIVVLRAAQPD